MCKISEGAAWIFMIVGIGELRSYLYGVKDTSVCVRSLRYVRTHDIISLPSMEVVDTTLYGVENKQKSQVEANFHGVYGALPIHLFKFYLSLSFVTLCLGMICFIFLTLCMFIEVLVPIVDFQFSLVFARD